MEQSIEFKSNFKNYKLAFIWLMLLGVLVFPWLFLINQFDKVFAGLALLTDLVVVAIIIYQKYRSKFW